MFELKTEIFSAYSLKNSLTFGTQVNRGMGACGGKECSPSTGRTRLRGRGEEEPGQKGCQGKIQSQNSKDDQASPIFVPSFLQEVLHQEYSSCNKSCSQELTPFDDKGEAVMLGDVPAHNPPRQPAG